MPSWELQRLVAAFLLGIGIGIEINCFIYMAFYMPQVKENNCNEK